MPINTESKLGQFLETYVNLFSNKFNEGCDICWFIFGQFCAAAVFGVLGFIIGKFL